MIKLTPIEIERHEFKTVWRGYDPDEVRSFLAQVAHQLTTLVREQEKAEESLALKAQRLAQVEDYETRLRDALMAASSLADQTREEARRESELLIKEAELRADQILKEGRQTLNGLLNEIQSLKRQRERLSIELRSIVESHLRMLENQEEHLQSAQKRWQQEESEWQSMSNTILAEAESASLHPAKGDTLLEARELTLALGNPLADELMNKEVGLRDRSFNMSSESHLLSPSIPEPLTNRPLVASRLNIGNSEVKPPNLSSSQTITSGEATNERSGLAKLQQVLSEVPRAVQPDHDESQKQGQKHEPTSSSISS